MDEKRETEGVQKCNLSQVVFEEERVYSNRNLIHMF
jgi:hypothetical protein